MESTVTKPLIVAFVADMMFTSKIENVIRHLEYRVQWIERAADIGDGYQDDQQEPLGEMLHGREGQLFEKVTAWQPALLLFDLSNQAIPWRRWIPMLKSSAATRQIPVMTFGSHMDVDTMQTAKQVGADFVFARSRFVAGMPQLLQDHARIPDYEAIITACQGRLPPLVISGIEQFNSGAYYACHDDLEEAWRQDDSAGRDLYRGILQVAIAYFQIERGNYRGAMKMLLRLRQWLEPLPGVCRGVNVAKLRKDAAAVQEALAALGPERISEFDHTLFKQVESGLD